MTKVNEELLLQTLDQVERENKLPEKGRWDQGTWRWLADEDRCKTSMCFAGWAIELHIRSKGDLAGIRWLIGEDDLRTEESRRQVAERWNQDPDSMDDLVELVSDQAKTQWSELTHIIRDRDGVDHTVISAGMLGQFLLGIDDGYAEDLFASHNSIYDLRELVGELVDVGRIQTGAE